MSVFFVSAGMMYFSKIVRKCSHSRLYWPDQIELINKLWNQSWICSQSIKDYSFVGPTLIFPMI